MKLFKLKSPFSEKLISVMVNVGQYTNDRPTIEILEEHPLYGLEPYAVASVNIPELNLEPNEVIIKNYSENEGILEFLLENNIVSSTKRTVSSGFVLLPICILNPKSDWKSL